MVKHEIKLYEWVCERCNSSEEGRKRPAGWGTWTVHGCGMTGYTDHRDICAECVSKADADYEWIGVGFIEQEATR